MKNIWPIIPTQISEYDSEISMKISDQHQTSFLKDGVGLIDYLELKGVLTQMSSEFRSPCTIIEFTNSKEHPLFRTDSGSYKFDIHPTCRMLRKESSKHHIDARPEKQFYRECSLCHKIDNLHVELFQRDKDKITPANTIEMITNNIKSIGYVDEIKKMAGNNDTNLKFITKNHKSFLEYDCPFLGYKELLFPIFIKNRHLVGLLFVGEILLEENRISDSYKRIQHEFFKHQRNIYSFDPSEKLQEQISKSLNLKKSNPSIYLSSRKYSEKIDRIVSRIERFENKLNIEYDRKKIKYISKRFETYNQETVSINRDENENLLDLKPFWSNLNEILNYIYRDFHVDKFCVFSHNNFKTQYFPRLNIVYECPKNCFDGKLKYFYLDKIKNPDRITSNINNESLEIGMGDFEVKKDDFIKLYPVSHKNNTFIVIFISFNSSWSIQTLQEKDNEIYEVFINSLDTFFHIVSAKLSILLANFNARINTDTLKIFGHEMAQFFSGIDSINNFYLKSTEISKQFNNGRPLIMQKNEEQIKDIAQSLEDYLTQIIATNSRSRYLVEIPELIKTSFWPFKNLIFKWYSTNRTQLAKEKKKIIINEPEASDPDRPKIYADLKLLQHVFYNLIINAIKYSYRGSNIYIDGSLNTNKDKYIFTITSFGIEIPKTLDIYALYTQSETAKHSGNEGLGIGLYISRNIILAHNGTIDHDSELISDYNIPVLWEFNVKSSHISLNSKIQFMKEFSQLSLSGIAHEVVTCDDFGNSLYHPSIEEIKGEILKKTYRNTFIVEIPHKN